ncbi:hypothetical protein QQX98_008153 [Neonectria punicea]|uniref:Uncharacterized protein n=1 Tax=Neonectria punicea TaxID=979145 RepID=A0ABR1GVS5_9HYPO
MFGAASDQGAHRDKMHYMSKMSKGGHGPVICIGGAHEAGYGAFALGLPRPSSRPDRPPAFLRRPATSGERGKFPLTSGADLTPRSLGLINSGLLVVAPSVVHYKAILNLMANALVLWYL